MPSAQTKIMPKAHTRSTKNSFLFSLQTLCPDCDSPRLSSLEAASFLSFRSSKCHLLGNAFPNHPGGNCKASAPPCPPAFSTWLPLTALLYMTFFTLCLFLYFAYRMSPRPCHENGSSARTGRCQRNQHRASTQQIEWYKMFKMEHQNKIAPREQVITFSPQTAKRLSRHAKDKIGGEKLLMPLHIRYKTLCFPFHLGALTLAIAMMPMDTSPWRTQETREETFPLVSCLSTCCWVLTWATSGKCSLGSHTGSCTQMGPFLV